MFDVVSAIERNNAENVNREGQKQADADQRRPQCERSFLRKALAEVHGHTDTRGKEHFRIGNSKSKGPVATTCAVCWRAAWLPLWCSQRGGDMWRGVGL